MIQSKVQRPDAAEAVRDFYERLPYPRPIDSLQHYQRVWQDADRRRADYHLHWPAAQYRENRSILVAGCGTSQAAKHAMRWQEAQVTGIDFTPEIAPRRPGDPARIVANGDAAARDLDWQMRHSLDEMVASAWQARQAHSS